MAELQRTDANPHPLAHGTICSTNVTEDVDAAGQKTLLLGQHPQITLERGKSEG